MGCQGREEGGMVEAERGELVGVVGGSCFRMAVLKNRPPPTNPHHHCCHHLAFAPCDLPGDQNTAAAQAAEVAPTPHGWLRHGGGDSGWVGDYCWLTPWLFSSSLSQLSSLSHWLQPVAVTSKVVIRLINPLYTKCLAPSSRQSWRRAGAHCRAVSSQREIFQKQLKQLKINGNTVSQHRDSLCWTTVRSTLRYCEFSGSTINHIL